MDDRDLKALVAFMREAERLKNVTRTSWTSEGNRESVAEHSWRLSLLALVLEEELAGIDVARLLRICIIHDLGEALGGDISAVLQTAPKAEEERADLVRLLAPLPDRVQSRILALWDEYETGSTPEARIAKALDKIETIIQHNQGSNPPDFDYGFNLGYGQGYTNAAPLITALRGIVDQDTALRAAEHGQRPAE